MSGRSVQVQLVLYADAPAAVERVARAAGASVAHARGRGAVRSARVAVGDCSPAPVVDDRLLGALRGVLAGHGVHDVTYEFFAANLGSGGGSNRLAAGAPGEVDVLWVLNPDTYPAPTALAHLLDALVTGVAAVDARQVPVEHPKGYDPERGDAAWVSGASMVVDRAAFDAVGGFDAEHFPMYCDDVDLSWRLRLAGHRVVHQPRAVVFHDKRIGLDGRPPAGEGELEWGVLARLLLARRYGRPDVEDATVAWVEARGEPPHRRALATFRERVAAGAVPQAVEGAVSVADLDTDFYGSSRFRY